MNIARGAGRPDIALVGTAFRMANNDNQLGTCSCTGEFQAAQHVIVDEVACHARTENIAYTMVED